MRFWLALTGVLLFAAGGAVGFISARGRGGESGRPELPFDFDPEAPARLLTSKEVYEELDLSDAQRSRIDSILSDHRDKVSRIRASLASLAGDLRQGLEDVLTPEQRSRFEGIKLRIEERRFEELVNRKIEELRREIGLTPEQEEKVRPLFRDAEREKRECWKRGPHGDRETMRKDMAIISTKRDDRLAEILTPEQFSAYKQFKEREHSRQDRRR